MKLPGIGPAKLNKLQENQLFELEDLLEYLPRKYILVEATSKLIDNKINYINCEIIKNSKLIFKGKLNYYFVSLQTTFGEIKLPIFNQPFLMKSFKAGEKVTAQIKLLDGKKTLVGMKKGYTIEPYIEVKYSAIGPVKDKDFKRIIQFALENIGDIRQNVPIKTIKKRNLLCQLDMYRSLHQPKTLKELKLAKITYLYRIFYSSQVKSKLSKEKIQIVDYFAEIEAQIPYKLTLSQTNSIEKIMENIKSGEKKILVHGDVGSGKTIIGFIFATMFSLNNRQTVFASPTTLLAKQHYENFLKIFPNMYDKVAYLDSKSKDRKKIENRIKTDENLILFGTHVTLNEKNEYLNLGLLIIDEQQRFGVSQRNKLERVGLLQLMLTATPIPKTYADLLYNNVSLVKLDRFREPKIKTQILKQTDKKIQRIIAETIIKKQKIYAISSRINSDEQLTDLNKIKENLIKLEPKINPKILSSNNSEDEKNDFMNQFKNEKINCLIATSLIEVGIDVAQATLIIIFDSHRFGLSQLHQLRGRVGRNSLENNCLLLVENDEQMENERLRILEQTNDGFILSEMDYIQRGPGELLGNKQSGNSLLNEFDFEVQKKILETVKHDLKE
jgi:ATP-dependent DNA helicase RecG